MAAIAGGRKRVYYTNTTPAVLLIDFYVWIDCPHCGVPHDGFVFTLTPESDTPEERIARIKDAGPFCCDVCNIQIQFTEQAKTEFLGFYQEA